MAWHSRPPPPGAALLPIDLADLIRRGMTLRVMCRRCKHQDVLYPATLAEKLGPDFLVNELAPRLRCTECDGRGMASVHEVGR
jgi:hypothetical protein